MVAIDATLQYEVASVLEPVEGAADTDSPTGKALPTYDGGARAQLVTAVARLASILAAVDTLETNTAGLASQATLATVSATLTTIQGLVDALETNTTGLASQATLATVSATLTTIQGLVDGLEATASALLTELQLKADLSETQPVSFPSGVEISNDTGNPIPVTEVTGLVPEEFDFIDAGYNGDDKLVTAVFKTGGAGGTTVATLTCTYTASGKLDTVTRS